MDLIEELTSDNNFSIERSVLKLCCDLTALLKKYDNDKTTEKVILLKIENFNTCLQFCIEKLISLQNSFLQDFYCLLVEVLFNENEFSFALKRSVSGVMQQCSTYFALCSTPTLETCQELFRNSLQHHMQEVLLVEESNFENAFKNVNIIFESTVKFPSTFIIETLKVLTELICSNCTSYNYARKCLSVMEVVVAKTGDNVSSETFEEIFCHFSSLLELLIDEYNLEDKFNYSKISTYFDCLRRNHVSEKVAFGIDMLNIIFGYVMRIDMVQEQKISNILQIGQVWVMLLKGSYHHQAAVRRKTSKTLSVIVECIKKNHVVCHITWCNCYMWTIEKCFFRDEIISVASNNLTSISFLLKFVEICELLEENQTHVLLPSMYKIKSFVEMNTNCDANALWVFPILLKMFFHENKTVQLHGLLLCFNCNFAASLMKQHFWSWFVSCGMMEVLSRDSTYSCDNLESSSDEKISKSLNSFLLSCHKACSFPQQFLRQLLISLCDRTWGSISLLYVCEAVYQLPSTQAWRREEYPSLRKLFIELVGTQNTSLRISTQYKLVGCLVKHCCPPHFHLNDLFALLSNFSHFASPTWNKVSVWILDAVLLMKSDLKPAKNLMHLLNNWLEKCLNSSEWVSPVEHVAVCLDLVVQGTKQGSSAVLADEISTSMMSQISSVSDKAASHLYMSPTKVDRSYAFVKTFFKIQNTSRQEGGCCNDDVTKRNYCDGFLSVCVKVFEGLGEHIKAKIFVSNTTMPQAELYLSATEALFHFLHTSANQPQRMKIRDALKSISHMVITYCVANSPKHYNAGRYAIINVMTLQWCLKHIFEYSMTLEANLLAQCAELIRSLPLECSGNASELGGSRRESSLFYEQCWICVPFIFRLNPGGGYDLKSLLESFHNQLEVVPNDGLVNLFQVARSIFAQVEEDSGEMCASCIETMLKTTFEQSHSSIFRDIYHHLVHAVFQPSLFNAGPGSILHSALAEVFAQIITNSEHKLYLLEEVLELCQRMWSENNVDRKTVRETSSLIEFILSSQVIDKRSASKTARLPLHNGKDGANEVAGLGNGCEIPSNDDAPLSSAYCHVDFLLHCLTYSPPTTKDIKSVEHVARHSGLVETPFHVGHEVSMRTSSFLLCLDLCRSEHLNFANLVFDQLLELDLTLAAAKSHQHFASTVHVKRQKIWQNITLLIPTLQSEKCEVITNHLIGVLSGEMQSSVRHFVEWSLVLLLFRFPVQEKILVEKLGANKSVSIYSAACSHLTVLLLCGVAKSYISGCAEQDKFFLNLLNIALPWCMSQQFTVRLYAHAVLLRIQQHFIASGKESSIKETHPWLKSCLEFADNSSGNVKKNWLKIRQHFMLFNFDPIAEFSVETIFVTIPRLCHVTVPSFDEFEKNFESSWLPLYSMCETLRDEEVSEWKLPGGDPSIPRLPDAPLRDTNVQKKVVVEKHAKRGSKPGVVVVASLLNKMSNLGGLSRTCEVFGAEKLVVANLNCTTDPAFQSLSVTAHKWLPMEEVKPHKLAEYLAAMRRNGYTIVGAEQTEKSEALNLFRFPSRSVIVMGNEKEGIPPSLLTCMDVCVEIPQSGMIRSLNVHVSGAIVVWEYHKQHLNS